MVYTSHPFFTVCPDALSMVGETS